MRFISTLIDQRQAVSPARLSGPFAVIASMAVVVAGCARSDPNRGEVRGTVTIDGEPVAAGAVMFIPTDGAGQASGGKIVDGQYTVNAWVGPSKVAVRAPIKVGERKLYDTADSPVQPVMKESLPSTFNEHTTLTFDVKPGNNEHDIQINIKQ
jgi:hypothetical protein